MVIFRYYSFDTLTKVSSSSSSSAKRKLVIMPPMLTVPWWSSSASVIILSRKTLKRVGESIHPCLTPTVVLNQSPTYATIKTDCTSGLVVEFFNDLDQVGINVIKPNSRPKGLMPYSVKRLFKINKDAIKVFLMLEVPVTQYSKIEDLFCSTSTWSETCLFSCDDWFCLRLQPILTAPSAGLYLGGIFGWSCSGSCTVEGCLSWKGWW